MLLFWQFQQNSVISFSFGTWRHYIHCKGAEMQPADEMLQLHSAQNGNVFFFFHLFFSDMVWWVFCWSIKDWPYVLNFSCMEVRTGPVLATVVVCEVWTMCKVSVHSILVYFPSFAFHISVDSMLLAGTMGSSVFSQSDQLCEKKRKGGKRNFLFFLYVATCLLCVHAAAIKLLPFVQCMWAC